MNLSERALFLVRNLNLPEASGVDGARWEYFQLAHLSDNSTFRIENKSRQIAWSFTVAAEAVAEAALGNTGSVFVSINLDEAKEKIRYARAVYDNLMIGGLPKLIRDNELSLEFDNGIRLLSLPSKPPRGKSRVNVYLDEFGHVQKDREIYKGATALILKAKGGKVRVGSSPLGASGMFWEIFSEGLQAYPRYTRKSTPWWEIYAFCNDPIGAMKNAPAMTTAARVAKYARETLLSIYESMLEEDFQQEFECEFVDETTAWISWDLIKRNQREDLVHYHAKSVGDAIDKIPLIIDDINRGAIEPVLVGGVDVGRKKDLTEFIALGRSTSNQLPVRFMVSLDRVKYDDQEQCFKQIINALPFTNVLIDQNGIGAQLAENLQTQTGKAQGVNFTNATKELWAVEARVQAERGGVPIPIDRDLAYQIHSIKRAVTASKNNVFDTERNEKHHADKFWAWALAISAANNQTVELEVINYTSKKRHKKRGQKNANRLQF